MPQMSPMNWLSLFFMFVTIFMIFNTLNYFNFIYTPKLSDCKTNKNMMNWKW